MKYLKNSDFITGILMIILALALIFILIPVGVVVPSENNVLALSPDFWIKIITWFMLFVGTIVLIQGAKQFFSDTPKELEEEEAEYHPLPRSILMVAISVSMLFAYYHTINWLGMVLASAIFAFAFISLSGEKRWKITSIITVVLPIGLYYFFLKVTGIPMPLGIFE